MRDVEGLSALVTGGASGIGAASAALLAERGARVAVADLAAPRGTEHLTLACDVTDRSSVSAAVNDTVGTFGGLDIVVNNAGIGAVGDVSAQGDDEWHRLLDVNVVGMARVAAAAMVHLRRSEHAAIVLTSSVVATLGVPQRAAYAASKGAVQALTLAMAADHVREGVRVNCVAPGTTDTPWVGRLLAAAEDPQAASTALSGSTTGTVLTVDGGMSGLRLPS
jgi:NAD(P)-dependent dehydrogenase (short-subunit alcohol dehydrogenase family)